MTSGSQNRPPVRGAPHTGRFPKGVSGNPGGKPRIAGEVRALLEARSLEAAEKLVALMETDDPKIALAAATAVLDRVLGKPKQAVEVESPESVNKVLAALIAKKAERESDDDEQGGSA